MDPIAAIPAYIVAARRTALGRVGGLHRTRRVEDLTAPVIEAALADARVEAKLVDELILGNTSAGGNPARLAALAAGLPETTPAITVDRQCGSGLDAILIAIRIIAAGEADVIVAGGAESLSTAPWRIAKPKSLYQLPYFIGKETNGGDHSSDVLPFEACEALALKLGISRQRQDAYAFASHLKAHAAREARRFVGEIVPLRANPEEGRDQSAAADPNVDDLERELPYFAPDGTLTPGNTSTLHDGAAIVVVVSERMWQSLGKPPALRLVASAALGVAADAESCAPLSAIQKLYARLNGFDRSSVGVFEMNEVSAAQAIALVDGLGLDERVVNPDGGAVTRGHPLGASGAVLVTRLFTRMARARGDQTPRRGAVVQSAVGGLGLAAVFEST